MENYNWIKARYVGFEKEHDIVVRQLYSCSNSFVDKDGNNYGVTDLDFTQVPELHDVTKNLSEREYWRKLRVEIFASVCNYRTVSSVDEALETTTRIMDALYDQDKDFFKDK